MSDDFGMSSEDEDELLAAAEEPATGKCSLNLDDGIAGNAQKRAKSSNGAAKPVSASARLANDVLKGCFGLDGFRLEQEAAITRILDGGSAVVVFPTGGGKSLCYQVTSKTHNLNKLKLISAGASCLLPLPGRRGRTSNITEQRREPCDISTHRVDERSSRCLAITRCQGGCVELICYQRCLLGNSG